MNKLDSDVSNLKKLKQLAYEDSQINTSGRFDKFTDFQNIMFSELCLIELLWTGDEINVSRKTIGQLYIENFIESNKELKYDELIFDGHEWLKMADSKNRHIYRNLVLGKLVRYGFSDIKIKKMIRGKDSFDVFILQDVIGNFMVYFPCTNIIEVDDFLYDSYNAMSNVTKNYKLLGKFTRAAKKYRSQQNQAKETFSKCVSLAPKGSKINVYGFSLGGSLAETSFLENINFKCLENLILFNPYHNNLTVEQANKLKQSGKLKIYACEGDLVSTLFNYGDFCDITKPIYIEASKKYKDVLNKIEKNNLLNPVVNYIKNDYCDLLICYIQKLRKRCFSFDFISKKILNISIKQLKNIKKIKLNTIEYLGVLDKVIKNVLIPLKKIGLKIPAKYDLDLLKNIKFFEYMLTSPHLPYGVDIHKNISFDKTGKLLKAIHNSDGIYEVKYPSFSSEKNNVYDIDLAEEVLQEKES